MYLTLLKFGKYWDGTISQRIAIAPTRNTVTGSIDQFANCLNLKVIYLYPYNSITGNINILFANLYKILNIEIGYLYWDAANQKDVIYTTSTNVSGNINVLCDKYDLDSIRFYRYSNIVGELKSLKNLKKFYICYFTLCDVTGAKADLYNNGANITIFSI